MFIRAREDPALSINIQRIMVTDFFDDYMIVGEDWQTERIALSRRHTKEEIMEEFEKWENYLNGKTDVEPTYKKEV